MIALRVSFDVATLISASSRATIWSSVTSVILTTSITLYSCFVTCSMSFAWPSTVNVIRDIPGTSLWPTVRLSMLKLR